MKLQYIATLAAASILTIGGTALFSNNAIASSFNSTDSSVIVADNPCAGANPCASVNPCAGANPCAAADPCASANPCASNPCAGANPCAAATNSGQFVAVKAGNNTEGTFKVIEEDGKQYIELSDDFEVSQGPDLKIILHKDQTVASSIAESDYVNVAPLESFTGTQRYEVPDGVDINDYASVAVWCEEFNVTFGYAQF
ncbi:MAG: DM13 domain-containing protein [Cyanobacteria bacterium P01_E01_bin.35]